MRTIEIDYEGQPPIDAYGPGFVRVRGEVHEGCVLVGPDGAASWAGLADIAAIAALAGRVDLVFLGTGSEIAALDSKARASLEKAGLAVEVMATPSACRTYNVVLAEGRRVAAALIPV